MTTEEANCPTHDLLWPANNAQSFSASEIDFIVRHHARLRVCVLCLEHFLRIRDSAEISTELEKLSKQGGTNADV